MKEIKRIKGTKIEKTLEHILHRHLKYQNCYFWKSPSSAGERRQMEFVTNDELKYQGHEYKITQQLHCSCKNIYYSLLVLVDDKKKDIRAIKALVK